MPLCKLQLVKLVGTTTRGSISSCKNQKQCTGNTVQDGYGQCWGNYENNNFFFFVLLLHLDPFLLQIHCAMLKYSLRSVGHTLF